MKIRVAVLILSVAMIALASAQVSSSRAMQSKPRARDLGIPFEGTPGTFNAITDVAGVEVGHTTLISGEGKLQVGVGPSVVVLDQGKAQSLTSETLTSDAYAFVFGQQGLMAGVGLEGTKITRLNQ